jgi:hypothetical protein
MQKPPLLENRPSEHPNDSVGFFAGQSVTRLGFEL